MSEQKNVKDLFNRAYNVEQEIIMLKEDLKELKVEFEYHKEDNTSGLEKSVVKDAMRAAKAKAAQDNLKEKAEELLAIDKLIGELE